MFACSFDPGWFRPSFDQDKYEPHTIHEFDFSVLNISRGQGPRRTADEGIMVSGSCDDIGRIQIKVESKSGTDPCDSGFYISSGSKTVPTGLIPRHPIQPMKWKDHCVISLSWIDGATSLQEPIEFYLKFESVNHFLAKGDHSQKLQVSHKGN